MGKLIAILVLLMVAAAVMGALKRGRVGRPAKAGDEVLPFRKKDYLLTKAERSFYEVLRGAVGQDLVIFAKVRLMDLVYLPKGTTSRQSHQNRVISKHVDFVLCTREAVSPVLVIELDDSSHDAEDRQDRDAYVDRVLAAAGLPILHMAARRSYSHTELVKEIRSVCPHGLGESAGTAARRVG